MKTILIHWSSEDLQFLKSVLLTMWGHTHHFLYQPRIDFTYLVQSTRMATWNGQYIICILYWMASDHVILYPWKLKSSWKIVPSWWRRVSIHQNGGRQATLYGRGPQHDCVCWNKYKLLQNVLWSLAMANKHKRF